MSWASKNDFQTIFSTDLSTNSFAVTPEHSKTGWRRRDRPIVELKLDNAMGFLNKYCNRLPCDTFTQLSVLKKTDQLPDGSFQERRTKNRFS